MKRLKPNHVTQIYLKINIINPKVNEKKSKITNYQERLTIYYQQLKLTILYII